MVEPTPFETYARQNGFIFSKIGVKYTKHLKPEPKRVCFCLESLFLLGPFRALGDPKSIPNVCKGGKELFPDPTRSYDNLISECVNIWVFPKIVVPPNHPF